MLIRNNDRYLYLFYLSEEKLNCIFAALLHRTALKEGDAITVRSDDRHLSTNEILRRYQTQHNLCVLLTVHVYHVELL